MNENEVRANHDLLILTWGPQSGPGLIATRDFSEVFALGHWEYGKYTLDSFNELKETLEKSK